MMDQRQRSLRRSLFERHLRGRDLPERRPVGLLLPQRHDKSSLGDKLAGGFMNSIWFTIWGAAAALNSDRVTT